MELIDCSAAIHWSEPMLGALRALRAGFQLHLAKPVLPAELVSVVFSLASPRA